VALSQHDSFDEADLPELGAGAKTTSLVSMPLTGITKLDMASTLADVEQRLINWALARTQGNLAKAAEMLGVPRSTLQYKVGKLTPPTREPAKPPPDFEI
jgi:DNA-binding NtrC family response regulator